MSDNAIRAEPNEDIRDGQTIFVPYPPFASSASYAEGGHYIRSWRYGTWWDGEDAAFAFGANGVTITNQSGVVWSKATELWVNLALVGGTSETGTGGLDLANLIDIIITHPKAPKLAQWAWATLMGRADGGTAGAIGAVPWGYPAPAATEMDPYPIAVLWDKGERLIAEVAEIRAGVAGNIVASVSRAEGAAAPGAVLTLNGTVTLDLLDGPNRQISLTGNSTLNLFSNLRTHPGGYISGVTAGAFSLTIGAAAGVTVVPLNVLTPPQTANDRWAYAWFAPTPNLVLIGKCGEAAL